MADMRPIPPRLRCSLTGALAAVAVAAINVWLFRYSWLAGLFGLAVSKHVAIAWLCRGVGLGQPGPEGPEPAIGPGVG